MCPSSSREWLDQCSQRLRDFSSEIGLCIESANWEKLATILASRQAYLEQILSNPISEEYKPPVKELMESVLEQDAFFQLKIQEQRNKLAELQTLLGRGRRAVQAYNSL